MGEASHPTPPGPESEHFVVRDMVILLDSCASESGLLDAGTRSPQCEPRIRTLTRLVANCN